MTDERFPIWGFGLIGVLLGGSSYLLEVLPLDISIMIAGFIGLPTWFIGSLWFGIKSDELLGVENAFAYEAPTQPDTELHKNSK